MLLHSYTWWSGAENLARVKANAEIQWLLATNALAE